MWRRCRAFCSLRRRCAQAGAPEPSVAVEDVPLAPPDPRMAKSRPLAALSRNGTATREAIARAPCAAALPAVLAMTPRPAATVEVTEVACASRCEVAGADPIAAAARVAFMLPALRRAEW